MIRNTLIKTDGTKQELKTGELTLKDMYAAIGCDIVERVTLRDTEHDKAELWCDENGIANGHPVNPHATKMYRDAYPRESLMFPEDWDSLYIVGNAILTTYTGKQPDEI